ncbi:MAG TPA: HAD family hydrolase [Acidimicrobiales bacterium]
MRELWVFDVDGCLIDSLTGNSLRPGTVALLEQLHSSGATIVLWSAGGAEYAEARATSHGIARYVHQFEAKQDRDPYGRYIPHFVNDTDAVFVDDRPEDMPLDADVITVSPYIGPNPHDRGLERAAARVTLRLRRTA